MTTTDAKRMQAIKEREQAATEGPWRVRGSLDALGDETNDILAWAIGNNSVCSDVEIDADAFFIANARDDIPFLLARVERLEKAEAIIKQVKRAQLKVDELRVLLGIDTHFVDNQPPTGDEG